jgi:hypothetical protein
MKNLSLVTILALSTVAYAEITLDSISGEAKLFYDTTDQGKNSKGENNDLFNKSTSIGDAAINLDFKSTLNKTVKLNTGLTGVTTLGLENSLVGGTWVNHTSPNTLIKDRNGVSPHTEGYIPTQSGLNDSTWIDEANLVFSLTEKTTMVVGRQFLDTPMVFSESWNIASNSYDAAVAMNKSVKDLTVVGAWVGRSNIAGGLTVNTGDTLGGDYKTFLTDTGAFAAGLVYGGLTNTTLQTWYFSAPSVATITWVQADTKVANIDLGLQYAALAYTHSTADTTDASAAAVKIGTEIAGVSFSAAFSKTDKSTHSLNNLAGGASKLYTEAWGNIGKVAAANTLDDITSLNITIEVGGFGLYATSADTGKEYKDMKEAVLTYKIPVGNFEVTMAYVYEDLQESKDKSDTDTRIQAYLVYSF